MCVPMCWKGGGIKSEHVNYLPRAIIGNIFLPAELGWLHVVGQWLRRRGGEREGGGARGMSVSR